MKNTIKMSLVAALAVAGLSTTAAAEDTKFSGKLYVENHMTSVDAADSTTDGESKSGFEVDFDITGKKKISDTLTAVVGIEADSEKNEDDNGAGNNQSVTVDDAHFVYANKGVTVKFGKQIISTPTTDAEYGQGILATYTMGTVTAAAAHFTNNNSTTLGANDVHALALLGTAGPVNFELWNVGVASVAVNNTAVVSTKVAGWTVAGRLATTDYDSAATKDGSTTIISAAGKVNKLGLSAALLMTDKDGPALVTDATSKNTAEMAYFTGKGLNDATAIIAGVTLPINDKLTAIAKYGMVDFNDATGTADDSASEILLQANYKIAASTTTSIRYAYYTQEVNAVDTDKTHLRLDVTYKF